MLRYLLYKEINEEKWNDCVSASTERIVYAFSWYLNTVCMRWDAVVEEQEGRYVSVFPLPLGRRWGQLGVLQPYFTQQLGLFTTKNTKHKNIEAYFELIPDRCKSIYLQLNTENSKVIADVEKYDQAERVTFHLDLKPKYEDLLNSYRNRHKLNKAKRASLQIKPLDNINPLVSIFKATKGKELREVKEKHYRLLARLYAILKQQNAAELLQAVDHEENTLAAALFIVQPEKIIFLFSGSSEEGRKAAAMTLILDHVISRYAGSNRVLDFEGSMVPSVAKFYANFGAAPVAYVSLSKQHKPWYLKWKEAISIS
ncbi:peptidoglycan bridge formation glycyltransferase FemA/FemB family protein [Pontibacter locisalis]|uniref:Peptidoglycan bridge formation glycyltransferase FemA/FemB family protein n=1 Tax=Pontibacter locisalis TaxID=1719035 RepID=A0ABW5II68_9BACT